MRSRIGGHWISVSYVAGESIYYFRENSVTLYTKPQYICIVC